VAHFEVLALGIFGQLYSDAPAYQAGVCLVRSSRRLVSS
jgi:hypothetical protein